MGWSLGHDNRWGKFGRDIGYGVPAPCDHPGCGAEIDRGLSYVCGTHPYGGEHGCGLHFCGDHLHFEERGDVPAVMPAVIDARKNPGFRFDGSGRSFQSESVARHVSDTFGWAKQSDLRNNNSKSPRRKAASAKIAKIPLVLSRHIARVYRPEVRRTVAA
jgi:hypothetical protein